MTWVRHASRHALATVVNHMRAQLEALEWTDPARTPFGAPVLQIRDTPAITGDGNLDGVTAGTLAITIGREMPPTHEEMGGPLTSQEYPLFFDVFFAEEAVALACASDVRDILLGRMPDTHRFLPLIDQVTGAEIAGWRLELEDVERTSPDHRFPLAWQVVKATCVAYFPEVGH